MHEILRALPPEARVLDLGSGAGSYDAGRHPHRTVRLEIEPILPGGKTPAVQGDAARLPFRDGVFDAVICNHGLEHMAEVRLVLGEMGRVLRATGFLNVSVPDGGTLADIIYRFIAHGGGHVNRFRDPDWLAALISRETGLPFLGRRTLFTSLSFLHPANRQGPNRRYLVLLGAGERVLRTATWLFRLADRYLRTRLAIYGWSFYFGRGELAVDRQPWPNVCIRCGSGHPSAWLAESGHVHKGRYRCPACGTENRFTGDDPYRRAV